MNTDLAVSTLTSKYATIFEGKGTEPEWAIRKFGEPTKLVHTSIPFVGRNYFSQPVKMLVYASAENLTNYVGHLDNDDIAINRHRVYFDQSSQSGDFYPCVHIGPFDTGSLTLCSCYILSKFMQFGDVSPVEFLEMIAFGNYGKYTVKPIVNISSRRSTERNSDYANDPNKLKESHEYIAADIEVLKPDLIVMIDSTYNGAGRQKAYISSLRPTEKVIPIMQMLPRNINRYIAPKHPARLLDRLDATTARWYKHLHAGGITGKTKENYLSVFSYLDSILF